ncbi:hypothetical protein [Alicyclobacillus sp. ALC3]|nr:hypothetical protein [Alicyclobacillus sp. ALC3]
MLGQAIDRYIRGIRGIDGVVQQDYAQYQKSSDLWLLANVD